jgi:hypothetical protein
MKYFRKLIENILHYAQIYGTKDQNLNSSLRMKLLKVLYNLLLIDATPVKTLISEKLANSKSAIEDS